MAEIDTPSPEPDLAELLQLFRRSIALDLRVAAPATVTAYNPATQTATVQLGAIPIALQRDGTEVPQGPISIPGVPVCWPGGGSGYLTTPLLPGASGLCVFVDRALGPWLAVGTPVDPELPRAHALGDAVFLPGLRPVQQTIPVPTSQAATVLEGPLVHLGVGATHPVPHGEVLVAAFAAWTNALAAAGAAVAAPGVPDPTGALYTAYAAAITTATAALALTIADWVSVKVLAA